MYKNKGSSYSAETAAKAGLIPAAPVRAALRAWEARRVNEIDRLAAGTAMLAPSLAAFLESDSVWIHFDFADQIITAVNVDLWRTDPELSAIYQSFDFARLDLSRPTCRDADGLVTLHELGLSRLLLARMFGVSDRPRIITDSLKAREALAV